MTIFVIISGLKFENRLPNHAIIIAERGIMDRIYLDYAATTPLDENVLNAMLPYFNNKFGNPSSIHYFGQSAEGDVEKARTSILQHFNASDYELIFTSGGTESDNLALRGTAFHERKIRGAKRILYSAVEHHAVSTTAAQLETEFGFMAEKLPVNDFGAVEEQILEEKLAKDVAIVSIIYANNELGTINNVAKLAEMCSQKGIPFHTDAVQAVAHLDINLGTMPIGLMSFGAHKFYGPKGVGGLLVKNGLNIQPQITGGKQEDGFRAGTHNVPLIMGMAEALRIVNTKRSVENQRLTQLRDQLITGILTSIQDSYLTGHPTNRLPNHASFVLEGIESNELIMAMDMEGFAVSAGSACKVGNPQPSEVLMAIGFTEKLAKSGLRITMGRDTTKEHINALLNRLPILVERLRKSGSK
jgi:cysteine desulfurase